MITCHTSICKKQAIVKFYVYIEPYPFCWQHYRMWQKLDPSRKIAQWFIEPEPLELLL